MSDWIFQSFAGWVPTDYRQTADAERLSRGAIGVKLESSAEFFLPYSPFIMMEEDALGVGQTEVQAQEAAHPALRKFAHVLRTFEDCSKDLEGIEEILIGENLAFARNAWRKNYIWSRCARARG